MATAKNQPTPFQRDLSPTHAKRLNPASKEAQYAAEFESAELLTLGIVYEKASHFAGGAYSSFPKRVDRFSERTLAASLRERESFASRLLDYANGLSSLAPVGA
jgi:hypothetical protein